MYRPAALDVVDRAELFDLIELAAFGHLVTMGQGGFDHEWLRAIVTDLTDRHEAARSVESPWAVTDAPGDFIDKQLRAIVGIEVQIESIEGKRKLSQNRSEADRVDAAAALASSPRSIARHADLTARIARAPHEPVPSPVDTRGKFGTTRRDRFHGNSVDGLDRSGSVHG